MKILFSRDTISRIQRYARAHKALSTITVVLVVFVCYWTYKKIFPTVEQPRYMVAHVQKGTITATVSGTGQVSASNQIDLKAKASGDVVYVGVTEGQIVKAGTTIIQLDTQDAQKAVRDAKANLESAKISLQKIQQPADTLSITQAENALATAQQSQEKAASDLKKAYDDAFTAVSNAFLDLPTVVTGMKDTLYKSSYGGGQDNVSFYHDLAASYDPLSANIYRDNAISDYQAAYNAYTQNFTDYKTSTRFSDTATIEHLLDETYNTSKSLAQSVKSTDNLLSFTKDLLTQRNATLPSQLATHQANLASYTDKTNTNLVNLLNSTNAIKNAKDAADTATRSIKEKTESLAKLKAGSDALDIASAQLTVEQRTNALTDAQATLSNYFVRAPFDGTIAKVNFKKADSVSNGSVVATIITAQKIATISLNEVDVAKIKIGQKTNLSFDAVDGLNITGEVAQIDTVGTVTQGVVTYSVKINFDTQDDRVKSGMSVSAAIITDIKQDVLMVPNNAVKSQGDNHYVEIFDTPLQSTQGNQGTPSSIAPRQQPVEIGLSNDTDTEIVSGVKEGEQVVTRTITTATTATTQAPSLFGTGRQGATGATRTQAR